MIRRNAGLAAEVGGDTVAWYNRSAEAYAADTLARNPMALRTAFLERMPAGGFILDAGSGAGRDTLAFLKAGFRVDAFDASDALVRSSSRLTGQSTRVDRFETFAGPANRYDGVWAFASLLHVREADLPDALSRLAFALKSGGWLFANFKLGSSERTDEHGRRYTDMTADRLAALFASLPGWAEVQFDAVFADAAFGRSTGWVNSWARKRSSPAPAL